MATYTFTLLDPERAPKKGTLVPDPYGATVAYTATGTYTDDRAALAAADVSARAQRGTVLVTTIGKGGVTRRVTEQEHDHYTRTTDGRVVWSTQAECVKCGSGREY